MPLLPLRAMAAARRTILIVIVIIGMRIGLLRICTIEDEAKYRHLRGGERVGRLLQGLLLAHVAADHQQKALGPTAEYRAIVGHRQRGGINNHVIVLGERLLHHELHGFGTQQHASVRRPLAARQNVQVRLPVALHHVLRAHLSRQHVRQTGTMPKW